MKGRNNKINVKKISYLILVMVFIITSTFSNFLNISYGATYTNGIDDSFPEVYKQYLRTLRAAHPNWIFTAKNTGLNFSDAVSVEMTEGKSLTDQDDAWWKRDDIQVESGWVNASRPAIEYAMNPLNFLNEEQIFQFETLEYNSSIETKSGVDGILYATSMSDPKTFETIPIKYYDKDGNIKEDLINKTYSQVIFDAGKNNGVNPYHLAARIKNETQADIYGNLSINGRYHPDYDANCIADYRGLYNYYNISANGEHPIANALKYASTPGIYGEPWNNPEKAIIGGAMFIKNEYINAGQNTLYFEKYNVASTSNRYGHQYMTNILAAKTEASFIYKTYKESNNNTLNMAHDFIIPVYNGIVGTTADGSFVSDNTRVYLDDPSDVGVPDTFSIRSNAYISNPWAENVIHTITFNDDQKQIKNNGVEITRIARGVNIQWDKVRIKYLDNGNIVEGYIYQGFVKDLNYPKITNVSVDKTELNLSVNQIQKLNVIINPTDAWYPDVTWSSSNTNIATVDQNGNVTAKASGNATITVTSNETGKIAICTVSVAESSINLGSTSYSLLKGKTLTINPILSVTNSTYTVTVDKPEIATVSGNVITGVSAGTANITVSLNGTDKKSTASINVIEFGSDQNIVLDTTKLTINADEITKVNPETKVSYIKTNDITSLNNLKVTFKNVNDKVLSDTENVGTGTKMLVTDSSDNVLYTYTMIIYGDVSGDGKINLLDALAIQKHYVGIDNLSGSKLTASSVIKRNNTVNLLDALMIQKYYVGIVGEISQ